MSPLVRIGQRLAPPRPKTVVTTTTTKTATGTTTTTTVRRGGMMVNPDAIRNSALPMPQGRVTVTITNAGAQKIQVIKALREAVPSLGLKEAKDLVDKTPSVVKRNITRAEAQRIKAKLEAAGAKVEVK